MRHPHSLYCHAKPTIPPTPGPPTSLHTRHPKRAADNHCSEYSAPEKGRASRNGERSYPTRISLVFNSMMFNSGDDSRPSTSCALLGLHQLLFASMPPQKGTFRTQKKRARARRHRSAWRNCPKRGASNAPSVDLVGIPEPKQAK